MLICDHKKRIIILFIINVYNLQSQTQYLPKKMIGFLIMLLFIANVESCFIVHFVYYGTVPTHDYKRISKFNHPYIFHLDEQISLPNNYNFTRNLTAVEKSDIKKMEVVFHHGGLYLDNDQFIDIQCVKEVFCPLKNGLYLLDWTDRGGDYWEKAVPISFIYSSEPLHSTAQKIITSYNQSIKQTIFFSGPFHAQNYRDQFKFIKLNRSCEKHFGIQSWNKQKNLQYKWLKKKQQIQTAQQPKSPKILKMQEFKQQLFSKLWKSHSVIYPENFNYTAFLELSPLFNHVEIINKQKFQIRVVKYSDIKQRKHQLLKAQQYYNKYYDSIFNESSFQQEIQYVTIQNQYVSQPQSDEYLSEQISDKDETTRKNSVSSLALIFISSILVALSLNFINSIREYCNLKKHKISIQPKNEQNDEIINISQKKKNNGFYDLFKYKDKVIQNRMYLIAIFIITIIIIILFNIDLKEVKKNIKIDNLHKLKPKVLLNQSQKIQLYQKLFGIKWQPLNSYKEIMPQIGLKQLGIYKDIHIASNYDYLNLTSYKQYKRFRNQFLNTLNYSILSFKFNNSLQKLSNFKQLQSKNDNNIEKLIQNLSGKSPKLGKQYLIAYYLTKNPNSKLLDQYQRNYFNQKYNIHQIKNEQSLCIVSTEVEIASPSKFQQLFKSIQMQNYSNYHMILIDDNTDQKRAFQWYKYLQTSSLRLKNKIKIIRNHQKLGTLATHYAYVRKFCDKEDIVVNLDLNTQLIGSQVFNLINTIYTDQNIWFAYSKTLNQGNDTLKILTGKQFQIKTGTLFNYRYVNRQQLPKMKTYRQQLMSRVPISQFIQYRFNTITEIITPQFSKYATNNYQSYALAQLSGQNRIKFINDPLILVQNSQEGDPCQEQYTNYVQYKAKTKISMKPLKSLNSAVEYFSPRQYDIQFLTTFRDSLAIFQKCKQIFYLQSNLS